MSLKKNLLSAARMMNFLFSEQGWKTLYAKADFQVLEKLPAKNILVIAPHPDDEIFSCSGILSGVDKAQKVVIAYIFSGDKKSRSENAKEREEESKSAVRLLTNPEQIFFRQPDGSAVSKSTISELAKTIKELGDCAICTPTFSSPNADHREAVRAVVSALKIAKVEGAKIKNTEIWLYGIWRSLSNFNRILEIDWPQKEKLIKIFVSQHKERNYLKAIKSLNNYYGEIYGLKKPAEAFFALPAELLISLFEKEQND
ncbi:MAG: PIG-L family deacetylase [Candidatus Berkelbacteria bacterium]|nr:PIG-L family deacetylase [Candidatus Berkelbacteria bacterium]